MFDIKELFLIDMLKVIPGETQVDLLTIVIDLDQLLDHKNNRLEC